MPAWEVNILKWAKLRLDPEKVSTVQKLHGTKTTILHQLGNGVCCEYCQILKSSSVSVRSRWIWFVRPWKYRIHGAGLIYNLPVDSPPTIERQRGEDFPLHESSQAVARGDTEPATSTAPSCRVWSNHDSIGIYNLIFIFLDSRSK